MPETAAAPLVNFPPNPGDTITPATPATVVMLPPTMYHQFLPPSTKNSSSSNNPKMKF